MSNRMTSVGTHNVTSSQASEGGALLYDSLDGQMIDPFGQEVAHANHSPQRGSRGASMILDTYGLTGNGLSRSADLQLSLESSLRQRLSGSSLFEVIWQQWITPWGQSQLKPRARALGTGGIGGGSLPTPSGTSNHGKNHVAGRLDEWGGSSNPFRGTSLGRVHCPAFELWVMGFPEVWAQLMPPVMQSSHKSQQK